MKNTIILLTMLLFSGIGICTGKQQRQTVVGKIFSERKGTGTNRRNLDF